MSQRLGSSSKHDHKTKPSVDPASRCSGISQKMDNFWLFQSTIDSKIWSYSVAIHREIKRYSGVLSKSYRKSAMIIGAKGCQEARLRIEEFQINPEQIRLHSVSSVWDNTTRFVMRVMRSRQLDCWILLIARYVIEAH